MRQQVTIKDIAKRAGVSIATVSHVLNNTRHVSEETAARVLEAVKALNYTSNNIARSLRSNNTRTIGVVVPNITNPGFVHVVYRLEETLSRVGYSVTVCNSAEDLHHELAHINDLISRRVDGIVLVPASPTFDYSRLQASTSIPFMYVNRTPNVDSFSGVFLNTYNVIYQAIEQIILSGHKRIACLLTQSPFSATFERRQAYEDAMKAHGLPVEPGFILTGPASIQSGYDLMHQAYTAGHVTAVFTANNLLSLGALQYLNTHNLRIPEDMAILGYGCNDWHLVTQPPLSTVLEPLEVMGDESANLLMHMLNNPDAEPKRIYLEARFTGRSSF